jgi:hypothetical protein
MTTGEVAHTLAEGNFAGIVFARTLHYQVSNMSLQFKELSSGMTLMLCGPSLSFLAVLRLVCTAIAIASVGQCSSKHRKDCSDHWDRNMLEPLSSSRLLVDFALFVASCGPCFFILQAKPFAPKIEAESVMMV